MGNQTGRPVNNAQNTPPRLSLENFSRNHQPDSPQSIQLDNALTYPARNHNDQLTGEVNGDIDNPPENVSGLTRENINALNSDHIDSLYLPGTTSMRTDVNINVIDEEGIMSNNYTSTPHADHQGNRSGSFSLGRFMRPSSLGRFSSASSSGDGSASNNSSGKEESSSTSLYGLVNVHITALPSHRMHNLPDDNTVRVSGKQGTLFSGINCNTTLVSQSMEDLKMLRPRDFTLGDSRASQLLVTHIDGWYAIPTPDAFSRHSGTCLIVGDKTYQSQPYSLKLGDCLRLGSVGLVVSEIKRANGSEERLNSRTLQYLRDEALSFEDNDKDAALLAEERPNCCDSPVSSPGKSGKQGCIEQPTINENPVCYMCYESTDNKEDPMVAPCDCKGDTRYLHVQCLQKWYQLSVASNQLQVIRTAGNGAPACKICGGAYKTTFRDASGRRLSLLEMDSSVPYLSLIVVTKHDTNPTLFNTKFRLNFGRSQMSRRTEPHNTLTSLTIGRSSQCNMILDYRTVSTNHAKISYENDEFLLQDRASSNGTMVYVREPVPLPYGRNARFRMGRCTLNVQAKRSWLASVRGSINRASSSIRRTSLLTRGKGDAPPQTPSDFFEQLTRLITMYNAQLTATIQKAQREKSLERSRAKAAEKMVATANVEAITGSTADEMIITSTNGNTNGISSAEKQSAQSIKQLLQANFDANDLEDHLIRDPHQDGGDEIFVVPDELQDDTDLVGRIAMNDGNQNHGLDHSLHSNTGNNEDSKVFINEEYGNVDVELGIVPIDETNTINQVASAPISSSSVVTTDDNEQKKRKINEMQQVNNDELSEINVQNNEVEGVVSHIEGQIVLSCQVEDEVNTEDIMNSALPTSSSPNATDGSDHNETESSDTKSSLMHNEVEQGGVNHVHTGRAIDDAEEMIEKEEKVLVRSSSPSSKVSPHRATTPRKLEFPNASTPRGGNVFDAEYSVSMPNTVISPTGLALPSTEQHDVVFAIDHDTPSSQHKAKETSPSSEKPISRGISS